MTTLQQGSRPFPDAVVIGDGFKSVSLTPQSYAAILSDTLEASDAIRLFGDQFHKPSRSIRFTNHGLHEDMWMRFSLRNNSSLQDYFFVMDNYFLDELTVILAENGTIVKQFPKCGDSYPFNTRPMESRAFVFPIHISTGTTTDIYVHMSTEGRKFTPFHFLMSETYYYQWNESKIGWLFLLFGILLIISLKNIYLAIIFKDNIFLWLGAAIASLLFLMICMGGFGNQYLWPNHPYIGHKAPILLDYLWNICGFLFCRAFLKEDVRYKILTNILSASVVVTSVLGLLTFSEGILEYIVVWSAYKISLLSFIFLTIVTVLSYKTQRPIARYLAVGVFLFSLLVVFAEFSADGGEYYFTRTSSIVLMISSITLLSTSVLDRLKILKEEKEKAQELAIERLQSLNDFKETINVNLETQVQKITDNLMKKQQEVNMAYLRGETKERKRIAEELHDGLGGLLSTLKMTIQSFPSPTLVAGRTSKEVLNALDLVNKSLEEVRSVSHNMMPSVLSNFGLEKAIENLVEKVNFSSTINIRLDVGIHKERFQSEFEINVFRIVVELLNNIIKHAKATRAEIGLIQEKDILILTVKDNGIGFNKSRKANGIGLNNIRSRVNYMNGILDIKSDAAGTQIEIKLPMIP